MSILDVRTWPARDYTRITIESDQDLEDRQQLALNHNQLIVDLIGIHINKPLSDFSSKIMPNDPHIHSVRVFQYKSNIVRMIFNMKILVKPQVFILHPVSLYKYRLVLDLYPAEIPDPLADLIKNTEYKEKKLKKPIITDSVESFFSYYAKNSSETNNSPQKPSINQSPVIPKKEKKNPECNENNNYKYTLPKSRNNDPTIRLLTVAIDPGHGGEDPGAIGTRGTYEKHIVLDIAKKLCMKIDSSPDMRAMMTRDSDFFVPLNVRVQKARRVGADLFVSIHADAFTTPSASGSSVFVLSNHDASSASASWIAKKENESDKIGGIDIKARDEAVNRTIFDMLSNAQIRDSLRYGCYVLNEISSISKLHKGSVEQAPFAVLKAPDIPSILVETAFISNPGEENKLNDENYRYKMASAIFRGIKRYFSGNPPLSKGKKNE